MDVGDQHRVRSRGHGRGDTDLREIWRQRPELSPDCCFLLTLSYALPEFVRMMSR